MAVFSTPLGFTSLPVRCLLFSPNASELIYIQKGAADVLTPDLCALTGGALLGNFN